jgi:hypothetical protein
MNVSVLRPAVLLIAGAVVAFPDDLEDAFQSLKQAESKKDAAQVKKLAAEASALARQEIARPAPSGGEEKEAWNKRLAFARDVDTYAEYALYATAVQAPPATAVELFSALEQQNPKSKYLIDGYTQYFVALNRAGAASKIPAVAEKGITHLPDNEDLLAVLADAALNRKQNDSALRYADRLLAAVNQRQKPESMSAADWQRKRTVALGRGHWIAGVAHHEKNELLEADKDLRAALPLIKGNDAMMQAALFRLGLVNYQLGRAMLNRARVMEAAKFSDEAAKIPGPYAQDAWRNAGVMRTEAARMR